MYKRQVEENGVAVNPLLYLEGNGTSSELQRMDPMKDIVSGTKVVLEKKDIETSGAVSYTHLDVYKRQKHGFEKSTALCFCC